MWNMYNIYISVLRSMNGGLVGEKSLKKWTVCLVSAPKHVHWWTGFYVKSQIVPKTMYGYGSIVSN